MAADFDCHISESVFEEAVIRGEEELYEDAFRIGALIDSGLMHVEVIKKEIPVAPLGAGEHSSFLLFSKLNADAIITDDRAFISFLRKKKVPFIIPSDVIARMVELRHLSAEDGLKALERIKIYITEDNYGRALEVIMLCKK